MTMSVITITILLPRLPRRSCRRTGHQDHPLRGRVPALIRQLYFNPINQCLVCA